MIPCSWDVTCPTCAGWSDYPQAVQDRALWLASTWLWAATGRRYGICPVTVRPSQQRGTPVRYLDFPVWPGSSDGAFAGPFLFGGRWFNAGCASACCGDSACAIVLRGPVSDVVEVIVDGEEVSPSAYRVDVAGGAWLLVRTDGGCWPACQSVAADGDAEGGFEVTYGLGLALPTALEIATATLACEYAKSLSGGACKLPAKMTRLSRQGVEVEVAPSDPVAGLSGIKDVDDVVALLNPTRRQSPPLLLSPDLPEACDRMTVVPRGAS